MRSKFFLCCLSIWMCLLCLLLLMSTVIDMGEIDAVGEILELGSINYTGQGCNVNAEVPWFSLWHLHNSTAKQYLFPETE